ncbi:hypothetical protein Q8W71_07035 [Methylobacterium sp. NEAU 140]|uniref:hypothetical protein n=1 Tax=Methylobacterium sp. NEAU 140 TaxID=3064945 RepID=UPI002732CA2F|nr:hypothetical protein [Methylobacterium sp. NEAU 140]MDP4022370.1 hypothetical protein [Methylobacterium sp. NEAU 140]
MRRALTPTLLLLAALAGAAPARAEDFTGFYAGINAGYGWGRNRDRSGPARPIAPGPGRAEFGSDSGSDLPPSAAGAAAALRRSAPPARGADAR